MNDRFMLEKLNPERNIILFIDDEKICHTLVDLIIPNFTQYKLINAYNGEEAVALARRFANNICLILSDIMLPDMTGYDIYHALKQDKKFQDVAFIFQSGLLGQEHELKKNIKDKDKVNIIYKPYKKSDLLEIISKVLG